MMNYTKQFEFEHWSNTLILQSLRELDDPDHKANKLFSHLLSSHAMWLSRVTRTDFTCTLFQERTLDECALQMQQNLQGWQAFLQNTSEDALAQEIEFMAAWEAVPSKRRMRIDDAIIHLINHSSYHRGQIVMLIKGFVNELPLSTYIIYASEVLEQ
jgi:uncharacterized damage-inducible protein DinB